MLEKELDKLKEEKSRLQDSLRDQRVEHEKSLKTANNNSRDVKVAEDKLDKVCSCTFVLVVYFVKAFFVVDNVSLDAFLLFRL